MKGFTVALSLFAALLIQANSLECEQCKEIGNMTSCTGPIAPCPEGTTKCTQGLENNTLDGDIILTAFKSCYTPETPEVLCSVADHTVINSRILIRVTAACGMNNDPFQVPPQNQTLNGYKCPDCFEEGTLDECISDEVKACTGTQTACFDIRAIGHRPGQANKLYSFKGCTTAVCCGLVHLTETAATDITCTCTPANLM
nr:sodefrin precursor-like factor beta 2 [Eurycea tynerensis]